MEDNGVPRDFYLKDSFMGDLKSGSSAGNRRAGPKRSEASKLAVQSAAITELIEHGWRSFSVDRVAKNAKASKQTIYRWWPGPALLVVEAAIEQIPPSIDTSGTPEARIAALIKPLITAMRSGDGAHVWRGVLLAAADDEDASDLFRDWMHRVFRTPLRHILAEQANKSLIRRDWDIDLALDLMIGPLWQRLIAMRAPVPERYDERVAEALMANMRLGAPSASH